MGQAESRKVKIKERILQSRLVEQMQSEHSVMLVPQGLQPLAHDAGGKLKKLQVEAMAVVFGAQKLK